MVSRFSATSPRDIPYAEVEALDKEIMQWYDSTPEEVKVRDWAKERMVSTPSYNLQRLRIWTYLRFNQVRAPPPLSPSLLLFLSGLLASIHPGMPKKKKGS